MSGTPPMPEGFTDQAAWDAIHWEFSGNGSALEQAVISWQRENQARVHAAFAAADASAAPLAPETQNEGEK